jgi:hypothetical protein
MFLDLDTTKALSGFDRKPRLIVTAPRGSHMSEQSAPSNWKTGIDWICRANLVIKYYDERPRLKFGPALLDKAFPLLNDLCARRSATQAELMNAHDLDMDDIMTILSNVTMAIQRKGKVWPPELGGWYTTNKQPYTYIVCPGFADAWFVTRAPIEGSVKKKP